MRLTNLIISPIITEKSAMGLQKNTYTFKVNKMATKDAIAEALKNLFNVDALSVKTMIMPGKRVRIKKTSRFTKTQGWKKAVVMLKEGQKIDLFSNLMGEK